MSVAAGHNRSLPPLQETLSAPPSHPSSFREAAGVQLNDSTPLLPDGAVGGQAPVVIHPVVQSTLEKFVFLWLGIGRSYCEL